MKIALSGNFYALPDILETQEELEKMNHEVIVSHEYISDFMDSDENKKEKNRKTFFEKMKNSDALLVVNSVEKMGKENYISGSSFLEMGFAHALGKKIFIFKDIPEISYKDEILAMSPIALKGNLQGVK